MYIVKMSKRNLEHFTLINHKMNGNVEAYYIRGKTLKKQTTDH